MDEKALDEHFNNDLIKFVEDITVSDHGRYRSQTEVYKSTRKMKIRNQSPAKLC